MCLLLLFLSPPPLLTHSGAGDCGSERLIIIIIYYLLILLLLLILTFMLFAVVALTHSGAGDCGPECVEHAVRAGEGAARPAPHRRGLLHHRLGAAPARWIRCQSRCVSFFIIDMYLCTCERVMWCWSESYH